MIPSLKAQICHDFFVALTQGGIGPIVNVAHKYLQRPILIVDSEYKILAQVPRRAIGDRVWDTILGEGEYPLEILSAYAADFSDKSWATTDPVFIDWGLVKDFPRLAVSAKADNKVKVMISVYCADGEYTDDDVETLKIFRDSIKIEVLRNMKYLESYNKPMLTTFLNALLNEDTGAIKYYHNWLYKTGFKIEPQYCVVVAKPPGALESAALVSLCAQLTRDNQDFLIFHDNENIHLLYTYVIESEWHDFIKENLRHEQIQLSQYGFTMGISGLFDNIVDFGIHGYKARRALELGLATNDGTKDSAPYTYDNYLNRDILSYASNNMDPANFTHPSLALLKKYDEENKSEYSHTLKTYLKSMCDAMKTCAALHIQRSSLSYRLGRIESLANIDLSDFNTRMQLLFNFLVAEDE